MKKILFHMSVLFLLFVMVVMNTGENDLLFLWK
jgi:hypothetical protein